MIKLPINIINEDKGGWKETLSFAHKKLDDLKKEALLFQTESGRFIRPIMLVRVERTGKEQRDTGFVHTEDAREYHIEKLGVKVDLKKQVNMNAMNAEQLFREKLENHEISLRLVVSKNPALRWELAKTLEIDIAEEDQGLYRKDGQPLEKNLFDKVYQRDFNSLEKETAWYLDTRESVYWWHRIAVNQRSYSLQGWQRQRIYPDLLACLHGEKNGKVRFSILETKGEHLKRDDDTEYKRQLFKLLTEYSDTSLRIGELDLGEQEAMTFSMLMENTWKQSLTGNGII